MEAQHADVGYSNVSYYKGAASQEFKARLMDRFIRKASLLFINSCGRSLLMSRCRTKIFPGEIICKNWDGNGYYT